MPAGRAAPRLVCTRGSQVKQSPCGTGGESLYGPLYGPVRVSWTVSALEGGLKTLRVAGPGRTRRGSAVCHYTPPVVVGCAIITHMEEVL